jgi:hypothetical protein
MKWLPLVLVYLFMINKIAYPGEAGDFNPEKHIYSRAYWGAEDPGYNLHVQPIKKMIIIASTVDSNLAEDQCDLMRTMQKSHKESYLGDIKYHFCIDKKGNCYEGRSFKYYPALIREYNEVACAIGIIGTYEDASQALTDEDAWRIGKQLGRIAYYSLEWKELVHEKNVFGMSELEPIRYPVSPGQFFLEKVPVILKAANGYLAEKAKQ